MSETPRTDDFESRHRKYSTGDVLDKYSEALSFARQLERELTQAKAELSTLRAECERLRENRDGLQAHIDELMLEYCLDEMTEQQLEEYEKNQIAVALDRKDQP